jgi:hypothetical protein
MMQEASHEPKKKKPTLKRTLSWVFGLIGIVASTSSVVGLVLGWFNPDTSQEEQAKAIAAINQKLTANQEDSGGLVNQVSLQVTELHDEYKRIAADMNDIRRLAKSISQNNAGDILTPEQQKRLLARREKEREALFESIKATEQRARRFVQSVESAQALQKVTSTRSKAARLKEKAMAQKETLSQEIIPELSKIKARLRQ